MKWSATLVRSRVPAPFRGATPDYTEALAPTPAIRQVCKCRLSVVSRADINQTRPRSLATVADEICTFLPMATSAEVRTGVATLEAMRASAVKVGTSPFGRAAERAR